MNISKLLFCFISILIISQNLFAQKVPMTYTNGVYTIPCEVNGLKLNPILDTGASDVSISLTEALFMLRNGYMSSSDVKGTEYYRIANGDVVEGTKIILRKVKIGNKYVYNVEASIVHSLDAPLLLGQSVLSKLGKFTVDYSTNTLIIGSGGDNYANNRYTTNNNSSNSSSSLDHKTPNSWVSVDCNLMSKPYATSNILANLKKGDRFFLLKYIHSGYWTVYYQGFTGYLHQSYIGKFPHITTSNSNNYTNNNSTTQNNSSTTKNYNVITSTYVSEACKLRSTPSAIGHPVEFLQKGYNIKVFNHKEAGYWRVSYNGTIGYLNESYIVDNKKLNNILVEDSKRRRIEGKYKWISKTKIHRNGTVVSKKENTLSAHFKIYKIEGSKKFNLVNIQTNKRIGVIIPTNSPDKFTVETKGINGYLQSFELTIRNDNIIEFSKKHRESDKYTLEEIELIKIN